MNAVLQAGEEDLSIPQGMSMIHFESEFGNGKRQIVGFDHAATGVRKVLPDEQYSQTKEND